VGAVDDPLEREADAAAARVLRRQPAGGREPETAGPGLPSPGPAAPGIIRRTGYGGYGDYLGYGGGTGGHPCSPTPSPTPALFCAPFSTPAAARADRDSTLFPGAPSKGLQVLTGASIAAGGSGLATSLYSKFIYGGSPTVEDASAGAGEFTSSETTAYVTRMMVTDVMVGLMMDRNNAFTNAQSAPGVPTLVPVSAAQRAGVDTQQSKYALNFCGLGLPGVLAGGIGKTQTTGNLGADTSAATNDFRDAQGQFMVIPKVVSKDEVVLTVIPLVQFHVTDTIDFCPGNPGDWKAQYLTVPLSQWEASGISGDVTFQLDFPAPPVLGQLTLTRVNGVVIPRDVSFLGP
jgi:hypothetical protein